MLVILAFVTLKFGKQADPGPGPAGKSGSSALDLPADAIEAKPKSITIQFPSRQLPAFEFPECRGGTVSRDSLLGKRWLASFVFTRCVETCPLITRNVSDLHSRVAESNPDFVFVSFSVDSSYDTAEVLQKYAETFRADHERWKFLTGDENQIHDLIRRGFTQYVQPNLGEKRKPGFEVAHTNRAVLVNEEGIPVATYLMTDAEHVVRLRRVIEGKTEFPEPGPELTIVPAEGTNPPVSLTIVPAEESPEPDAESTQENQSQQTESAEKSGEPESDIREDDIREDEDSEVSSDLSEFQKTDDSCVAEEEDQTEAAPIAAGISEAVHPDTVNPEALNPETVGSTASLPSGAGESDAEDLQVQSGETAAERNVRIDGALPAWAAGLPSVNAALNTVSTVLLISGFTAIRFGRRTAHRNFMVSAFLVSVLFLISYLTYHEALYRYTGERGRGFVGSEAAALMYRCILWPHVALAACVPVLALRVFFLAWKERWHEHRRLARITLPVWLYVSVTGVVIYGMLYL